MFLYSEEGLEKLGVTEEQMETKIADEMSLSNEVAANSMINLRFNLAHVTKVRGNLNTPTRNTNHIHCCCERESFRSSYQKV